MMQSCAELYLPGRERASGMLARASAPGKNGANLVLEMGEVISHRLFGRPLRVACVAGRLWATVDGDAEDYVLLPGEERTFQGQGTVVIQALGIATARFDFNE